MSRLQGIELQLRLAPATTITTPEQAGEAQHVRQQHPTELR